MVPNLLQGGGYCHPGSYQGQSGGSTAVGRRRRRGGLADDQVNAFWARPEPERAAIWGKTFDLAATMAEFRPEHIPDE